MRIGKILAFGLVILSAGASYADDHKIVTSKSYVDAEISGKQPVLNPDSNSELEGHVVMYTGAAGVVSNKPVSAGMT